jgi:hypothetical protein
MRIDRSYVLAEPDPQKISAIACWLLDIYHVIFARMGLGSDVKLNLIELKDRIGGYVLCASENWVPYSSLVYGVCDRSADCACSLANGFLIHDDI